jgi:hypothetical protein
MKSLEKIYLLSPNNSADNEVKIIWADNEEDARRFSDAALMQRSFSDNPPLLEDGVYSADSAECEEITADVTNVKLSNNTINFNYDGLAVSLAKEHPELLAKFVK